MSQSKEEREHRAYHKLCEVVKKTAEGTGNGHKVTDEQVRKYAQERAETVHRERKEQGKE